MRKYSHQQTPVDMYTSHLHANVGGTLAKLLFCTHIILNSPLRNQTFVHGPEKTNMQWQLYVLNTTSTLSSLKNINCKQLSIPLNDNASVGITWTWHLFKRCSPCYTNNDSIYIIPYVGNFGVGKIGKWVNLDQSDGKILANKLCV